MKGGQGERDLGPILESLLCATGDPLTVDKAVEAIGGVSRSEVKQALKDLQTAYERDGRGFRLVEVGGGFQLRTAPEHVDSVRRLLRERPVRLTRPMLETLAIIAYRQPVTRAEIEAVRGVDVDSVVATLVDRRLIKVAGRKEAPGRPLLYETSREFLEVFGLTQLSELPQLREIGELEIVTAPEVEVGLPPPGQARPGTGAGLASLAEGESGSRPRPSDGEMGMSSEASTEEVDRPPALETGSPNVSEPEG